MPASIDDILREFSELAVTDPEKAAWLRRRLVTFTEELALAIERRLVEDPTFVGEHHNRALREAAAIVRAATGSR
jgi:hypothetical protein